MKTRTELKAGSNWSIAITKPEALVAPGLAVAGAHRATPRLG